MKKYLITVLVTALVVAGGMYFWCMQNASISTQDIKNNPAQAIAFVYISQNTEIDFKLREVYRGLNFAIYDVMPNNSSAADQAKIILKNNGTSWEVVAFGTAFPGLVDTYPELQGKI